MCPNPADYTRLSFNIVIKLHIDNLIGAFYSDIGNALPHIRPTGAKGVHMAHSTTGAIITQTKEHTNPFEIVQSSLYTSFGVLFLNSSF